MSRSIFSCPMTHRLYVTKMNFKIEHGLRGSPSNELLIVLEVHDQYIYIPSSYP